MNISNIASALRQKLDNANLGFVIIDENRETDTANVDVYLAEFMLPADTLSMGKAPTDGEEEIGIYQISIYTRDDVGRGSVFGIVDSIKAAFAYHDSETFGGTTVTVTKVKSNTGRVSGGRFVVDVSIDWFSYTQR